MKMLNNLIIFSLLFSGATTVGASAAPNGFVAGRYLCQVEVRAGNDGAATNNPVIYSGSLNEGQPVDNPNGSVFMFAQREANPGVCNSGRGYWNLCSWDTCTLI